MAERGLIPRLLRSLVLVVVLFAAPAPAALAADRLPDLRMAPLKDLVVETTTGGRRILRYTTIIVNTGAGRFETRGTRASTSQPEMSTVQRIFDSSGGFRDVATDARMYFAGDGHSHWHVRDLQFSLLVRLDNGVRAGTGAKHGFCFYDNYVYDRSLPGAPQNPAYTTCGTSSTQLTTTMGLSIGWGDEYPYYLVDQYIDITGLASGRYRLTTIADPSNWFLESDNSNNATSLEFQLTGTSSSADLSVQVSDSPDPVTVGANLTYTLTVRNNGPGGSSAVEVSDTIPAGATFVSASASQGTCEGTSTVTCRLGWLPNGATASATIVVRPTAAGALSNTASVAAGTSDGSSGNNTATATTTVDPPASTALATSQAPQGDWTSSYGADGYALGAWNGSSDLVALPNATLTLEQGARHRWQETTSQLRALQSRDGSYRRAATFYANGELRLRLDFQAAYSGTLHLYALDWDTSTRRQQVTVDDGSGARSAALTASFDQGLWVHAPITVAAGGSVVIRITHEAGFNAVLAGLFLGET